MWNFRSNRISGSHVGCIPIVVCSSLSLNFLTFKMGMIMILAFWACWEEGRRINMKAPA